MASAAQRRAQHKLAHASKATRRKWALKAAKTRCQNRLKLATMPRPMLSAPVDVSEWAGYRTQNPPLSQEEVQSLYFAQSALSNAGYEHTAPIMSEIVNRHRHAAGGIVREHRRRASNPELLTIAANPRGRKTMKHRRKRKNPGQRRIKFRGKFYYRIQPVSKFGKRKARAIWGRRCRKVCKVRAHARKRLGGSKRRALPAPKGNWMVLVKKYGVKGAKKHYHKRRR